MRYSARRNIYTRVRVYMKMPARISQILKMSAIFGIGLPCYRKFEIVTKSIRNKLMEYRLGKIAYVVFVEYQWQPLVVISSDGVTSFGSCSVSQSASRRGGLSLLSWDCAQGWLAVSARSASNRPIVLKLGTHLSILFAVVSAKFQND